MQGKSGLGYYVDTYVPISRSSGAGGKPLKPSLPSKTNAGAATGGGGAQKQKQASLDSSNPKTGSAKTATSAKQSNGKSPDSKKVRFGKPQVVGTQSARFIVCYSYYILRK